MLVNDPYVLRLAVLLLRPIFFIFRCSLENIKMLFATGPDLEDAGRITASVAIVRSRPYGCQATVVEHREPFHAQLVCTQNVVHRIDFEKFADNLSAKGITGSSKMTPSDKYAG
jgi:hypothetical protein